MISIKALHLTRPAVSVSGSSSPPQAGRAGELGVSPREVFFTTGRLVFSNGRNHALRSFARYSRGPRKGTAARVLVLGRPVAPSLAGRFSAGRCSRAWLAHRLARGVRLHARCAGLPLRLSASLQRAAPP